MFSDDDHIPIKLKDTIKKITAEKSYNQENVEIKIGDRNFLFNLIPIKGESYINFYGKDITEHKQAEVEIKESLSRIKRTFEQTIKAFSLLVEVRDPYTAGHQKRVSETAVAIAKDLGLTGDAIEAISSHRPYREAHTSKESFDEISKNKGILYDPDVVDSCIRLFNK